MTPEHKALVARLLEIEARLGKSVGFFGDDAKDCGAAADAIEALAAEVERLEAIIDFQLDEREHATPKPKDTP